MHYVYILLSKKDNNLYIGYTNNLKERLNKHNAGKVKATAPRLPLTLLYYEAYLDEWDAKDREQYFKTGWGRRYIANKLKRTLKKVKI